MYISLISPSIRLLFLTVFICCWTACENKQCFTCNDTFIGKRMCSKRARKEVDFSGMCSGEFCKEPLSCSHQLGLDGRKECLLYKGESGMMDKTLLEEGVFSCTGEDGACRCSNTSTAAASSLERAVTITAYPFRCNCTSSTLYTVALDIRVRLSGWSALGLVYDLPPHENRRRPPWMLFRLSAAAARGPGVLQYDCPRFSAIDQNRTVTVHLCTRQDSVHYQLRLPLRSEIENEKWQPLPVLHAHRRDRLVFSLQRAPPPPRCTRHFRLQLVVCDGKVCSAKSRPIQDTDREVEADCSESETEPGSFLVEYDLPKISGKIALKVLPRGGHDAVYSVTIDYEAASQVEMWLAVTVLLVVLVLVVTAFVWLKYFKPKSPELVDVLVVYNSNTGLARRVAHCLEQHCRISAQLDVMHIPAAAPGMDPVAWLTEALSRCQRVLLLVFPEQAAAPIYRRLFQVTVQHLQLDTEKTVVIGYSGKVSLPPALPAARRCRLPEQLGRMVAALRGGGSCSWRRLEAAELARQLRCSPEGKQLERQLRAPHVTPPEEAALPPAQTPMEAPLAMTVPRPPPRNTDAMASHLPDLDELLSAEGRPQRQLVEPDDDDDDGIEWH